MPLLFGKDSLIKEEMMLKRMAALIEELIAINLERQLKIAEADTMNGEEDADDRA